MAISETVGERNRDLAVTNILLDESSSTSPGCVEGPVRALMSAVLFDGVINCLNYAGMAGKGAKTKFSEAIRWIMAPSEEYIFSFETVCECLGIDAQALRYGIVNACNTRSGREKKARRNF